MNNYSSQFISTVTTKNQEQDIIVKIITFNLFYKREKSYFYNFILSLYTVKLGGSAKLYIL